jgi:hypothetical protein
MTRAPDYHLVLRPLRSDVPAVIRLRKALKMLLRDFGLRCVRIEQVAPEGQKCNGNRDEDGSGGIGDG